MANVKRSVCFAVLLATLQFGCTTMQQVDTTPEDLQAQIRAGKYLRDGHDVTIVTSEGKKVRMRFDRIENDAIVGHMHAGGEGSVPIGDVAGIRTESLNVGRTVVAVGGGLLIIYASLILLLIAAL